jgi:hypothetical protein
LHGLKIVLAVTEQLTLCTSISLGQDHVTVAWDWGVELENMQCNFFCNSQSLQFPLPPFLCEALVGMSRNFTLHVREGYFPKAMSFCYAEVAFSVTLSQVKTFASSGAIFQPIPPCDLLGLLLSWQFVSDLFLLAHIIAIPPSNCGRWYNSC